MFKSLILGLLLAVTTTTNARAGIVLAATVNPAAIGGVVIGAGVVTFSCPWWGCVGGSANIGTLLIPISIGLGLIVLEADNNNSNGDLFTELTTKYPDLNEVVVNKIVSLAEDEVTKYIDLNSTTKEETLNFSLSFSAEKINEINELMISLDVPDFIKTQVIQDLK